MDKNSAIGLTLIAVLLLLYFNYFSPEPVPVEQTTESVVEQAQTDEDSTEVIERIVSPKMDSAQMQQYGSFGSLLQGHPDMTALPGIDMSSGSLGRAPEEILQGSRRINWREVVRP